MAMHIPPWYEFVELVCILVAIAFPVLRLWPLFDRYSGVSRTLRVLWQQPYATHGLVIIVGVSVFFIAAEDVLHGSANELLPWVDHLVQAGNRGIVSLPSVRRLAVVVSDLTGPGLVTAVMTGHSASHSYAAGAMRSCLPSARQPRGSCRDC